MDGKIFDEAIDKKDLQNRKVLVEVIGPQDALPLVMDLMHSLKSKLILYDDSVSYIKQKLLVRGLNIFDISDDSIISIYDTEVPYSSYGQNTIVYNGFIAETLGYDIGIFNIHVYNNVKKPNTFIYYNYDIVIRLSPLLSGFSDVFDGNILIFSREKTHYDMKYKTKLGNIYYYRK